MKQIIFLIILSLAVTVSRSQSIQFSTLSLREALAKARQEQKPLFIEMYTTWCTYCRQMERDVFTDKQTGDYYNTHFINVRYDAQQSEGIRVRNSYALLGFPTFLYLDPNGLVLLKTAGFQTPGAFISNAGSALQVLAKRKHLM